MMKYPLKFCEDPTLNYEDLDPAEDDPNQGWGEPEDDEEQLIKKEMTYEKLITTN